MATPLIWCCFGPLCSARKLLTRFIRRTSCTDLPKVLRVTSHGQYRVYFLNGCGINKAQLSVFQKLYFVFDGLNIFAQLMMKTNQITIHYLSGCLLCILHIRHWDCYMYIAITQNAGIESNWNCNHWVLLHSIPHRKYKELYLYVAVNIEQVLLQWYITVMCSSVRTKLCMCRQEQRQYLLQSCMY